jgi:hypothetical protein
MQTPEQSRPRDLRSQFLLGRQMRAQCNCQRKDGHDSQSRGKSSAVYADPVAEKAIDDRRDRARVEQRERPLGLLGGASSGTVPYNREKVPLSITPSSGSSTVVSASGQNITAMMQATVPPSVTSTVPVIPMRAPSQPQANLPGPELRAARHVEFEHAYLQLAAVEGLGVTLA